MRMLARLAGIAKPTHYTKRRLKNIVVPDSFRPRTVMWTTISIQMTKYDTRVQPLEAKIIQPERNQLLLGAVKNYHVCPLNNSLK